MPDGRGLQSQTFIALVLHPLPPTQSPAVLMNSDMLFVFGLLAVVAVAMASNRVRFDIIALLVIIALSLSGILSVNEALAGFGNSVVILVAALLVVGEMLDRTGIARKVGDIISQKGGKGETRLLAVLMMSAGLLGGAMSSTAIVAIFIPIIVRIAHETGVSKSKLLIPMSYAALISGMLTLIATPTNLVVHGELMDSGYDGFNFFSFTPLGLAVLVAAVLYFVVIGRKLLPDNTSSENDGSSKGRSIAELFRAFNEDDEARTYHINGDFIYADTTVGEAHLPSQYGLRVLSIIRERKRNEYSVFSGDSSLQFRPGDLVHIVGRPEAHDAFVKLQGISRHELTKVQRQLLLWEAGASTVLIHPESQLINKTIAEAEFQTQFGLQVLGIRRAQAPLSDFGSAKLKASDSLFVAGHRDRINQLSKQHHDFIVLEEPSDTDERAPAYKKAPLALGILAMLIATSVLELMPLTIIVLCAALGAVLTRCMTMEDAYRSIHWNSIVLIAGLLPMADALNKTGGTDLIVNNLMDALGQAPHSVMFTALFFITAIVGMFLSNTATAVLLAPIAIAAAEFQDVSPYPYAIAVMIAASAAYSTPVSTPVVTLVMEPGEYKFFDFVKVGVPLLLVTWIVTLLVTPLMFPY